MMLKGTCRRRRPSTKRGDRGLRRRRRRAAARRSKSGRGGGGHLAVAGSFVVGVVVVVVVVVWAKHIRFIIFQKDTVFHVGEILSSQSRVVSRRLEKWTLSISSRFRTTTTRLLDAVVVYVVYVVVKGL